MEKTWPSFMTQDSPISTPICIPQSYVPFAVTLEHDDSSAESKAATEPHSYRRPFKNVSTSRIS